MRSVKFMTREEECSKLLLAACPHRKKTNGRSIRSGRISHLVGLNSIGAGSRTL